MKKGFYFILAAQFFSALADNVMLIAAIAMLRDVEAPTAFEPLLKTGFTLSYVLLAAFVGAFADSMPKRRVMLISNGIKIFGCALIFLHVHPIVAYAVVGIGAAAYSPAKYGILTEYLPARQLVVANGWIEGLTVGAIIGGTMIGGLLIEPGIAGYLLSLDLPVIDTGIDSVKQMTLVVIMSIYAIAAWLNLYVPDTGVDHKPLKSNPFYLIHEFNHCFRLLWRDKLGQISLGVTTLFWGAGATLQFVVIEWARVALEMDLTRASVMQGMVAFGVAVGSVIAARSVTLRQSVKVIPLGIAMGVGVLGMIFVRHEWVALVMMVALGILSGMFVVPMNALLQHRGHVLMGAGHSIAVQNFNENLSILVMTGIYATLLWLQLSIYAIIVLFSLFVIGTMWMLKRRHEANQRIRDDVSLLDG
jgi:LPLT family lysophospholipid transporter-like MFS transporter